MPAYQPEGGIYSGNVLIDVFSSISGLLTGERDVGNTRNLTFDPPAFEKKEKIGRRMSNYGQSIESIITKQTQSFKFTLDDINKENLVLSMFGASALVTVGAATVAADPIVAHLGKWVKLSKRKLKATPVVTVSAPTPDEWVAATDYALGDFMEPTTPNGKRYECTVAGTSAAVTEPTWGTTIGGTTPDGAGTLVWTCRQLDFVITTDFEVDYNAGMILAVVGGGIIEGEDLEVGFDHNAYNGFKVDANQVTAIFAQCRLVGKNVVNNDDVEVLVYRASLIPTGGLNWITEDFATLEFTGDIQAVEGSGTWKVEVLAG